ncbi:MAG: polysaccharide deacetylase family protein [Clostridiaceae bacterium]|jgi:polysaccharide deacetylase family sporulation protein PdaB|nr:polysaccharide deacetylase family protein [Clostridiaceae bacterium]
MQYCFVSMKKWAPILFLIVFIILVMINFFSAKEYLAQASKQYSDDIPIYSVECEGKKCAITFDCAWGADDIPNILDILDKYNAKGTFFIVGIWAKKYPDAVKLISDRGHEIANHGYSHAHMAQIPEDKIKEEILLCTDVLEEITGKRTDLFRPPYGEYNSTTIKVAKNLKYHTIQWDVDSLDWKKNMTKEDIYNRVTKRTANGSIILFHNDTLHTEKVLPSILENLTNNGFECIKVSDILLKENYKIRYDGRQVKDVR